jgi:hypothetical protein
VVKLDEDTAFEELEQFEIKKLESNEEIRKLISDQSSLYKTIEIGETKIRIKAYMPRNIRLKLLKIGGDTKRAKTEEEVIKAEKRLYPLIAGMCLDDPFNKQKTWLYLDTKLGCIQDVVLKIISEVNKVDEKLKSFR